MSTARDRLAAARDAAGRNQWVREVATADVAAVAAEVADPDFKVRELRKAAEAVGTAPGRTMHVPTAHLTHLLAQATKGDR